MGDSVAELWNAYLATGAVPDARDARYSAWQFGIGEEMGDLLLACVLDGPKRATAGALWAYEAEGEEVPAAGDHSVILDGRGVARCIIRTTSVEITPFDEVSEQFAYDEGEGDRSLEYWRAGHWRFFSEELRALGREPTRDMPVVCERFEVVFRDPDAGRDDERARESGGERQ